MTTAHEPLLGPISDIDRRRWQMAAGRALAEILKRADKRKLKPITWTVGTRLMGNLDATDYGNVDDFVADAFGKWVDLLGLTPDEPVIKSGGGLYLVGRHTNWRPRADRSGSSVTVIGQTFKL